jgi:SAM-dependent methyltransferase
VHGRRVLVLAERLAGLIPQGAKVLDVGCGDGLLAKLVMEKRPDVTIEGIDVLVRAQTHIPVVGFDGERIPAGDGSYDVVMFVDVLHHTTDPEVLLKEAIRVARRCVVIKDHTRDGVLAGTTLRFMDWVGNARHGVALPYNYWTRGRWEGSFGALGLYVEEWIDRIGLYPWWARGVFERKLHYIARLGVAGKRPATISLP